MTRVLLYSKQPILMEGLRSVIAETGKFGPCHVVSGAEDLFRILQTPQPTIAVLEIAPGMSPGALKAICSTPQVSTVLWGDTLAMEYVSQALAAGVRGAIYSSSSIAEYLECLSEVADGRIWIERQIGSGLPACRQVTLTPRQRQITGLIAQGLSNKEIAWDLGITEGTVKVYLSHIFIKTGAADRFQLALLALKNLPDGHTRIPTRNGDRHIPFDIPAALISDSMKGAYAGIDYGW